MTMTIKRLISSALLGTALVFGTVSLAATAHALSDRLEAFIGSEPCRSRSSWDSIPTR